jgi:hypothetical protein
MIGQAETNQLTKILINITTKEQIMLQQNVD